MQTTVDATAARIDRRATVAVAVQFAANGAFVASFMPRLPELRDAIGGTTQAVGTLLTVTSCSGLLASWTVRRVIARFGTRPTLVVGSLIIAVSLGLLGTATHWAAAFAALAVMYFFDVFVDVAMNMQGSWLSARRKRPIISRLHGLWSLGTVAGGIAAAVLAENAVSLRTHLVWVAAILAVASVAIGSQLLPTDETHDSEPTTPDAAIVPPGELLPEALLPGERQPTARSSRNAPRRSVQLAFFVAAIGAVTVETAGMVWAAFRLTDDLDAGPTAGSLAFVAMVGGMTLARLTGDHLTERFGSTPVMRGSALLAAAGLVVAGLFPVAWVAIIVVPVGGAAIAGATSIGVAIALLAAPAAAAFLLVLPAVADSDNPGRPSA